MVGLAQILLLAGVLVWILPPIRQYKGFFFDFFLVLAVIDPATIFYGLTTKRNLPVWVIALLFYLLVVSVLNEESIKKNKYILIILPLCMVTLTPFVPSKFFDITIIIENFVLLFIFLKWLITKYVETKKLQLFYLMLVFYILTIILKLSNFLIGFADASAFFIITSIAQIFFGLFFAIAREDGTRITD